MTDLRSRERNAGGRKPSLVRIATLTPDAEGVNYGLCICYISICVYNYITVSQDEVADSIITAKTEFLLPNKWLYSDTKRMYIC